MTKIIRPICTALFGVAVVLFFGWAYPHHLHYQEQYQLFLFDSHYLCDIVKLPGGVADLLGRFCTQFFLYAWVGALIIGALLSAVQLLMSRYIKGGWCYGLTFLPSFLLWLFLLDERALLGGVWAVLITLLAVWALTKLPKGGRTPRIAIAIAIPIVYWMVGPYWYGSHYFRDPHICPTLLYAAWLSAIILLVFSVACRKYVKTSKGYMVTLLSFVLVSVLMGISVKKNSNFKAEKVMQYDFMARYQQWNRILETINHEKPNNQISVTVQNLALAMHGLLSSHLFEYHQNGLYGLLPDVGTDAISPLPTAEAFYQLGMVTVAQRTVFEAQEAILDFQKSGRCYQRLAQTNLILGNYKVARKYLLALQKTLFYRSWATETLPLLGDEKAIAKHPEYGRLRQMLYQENFFFGDHVGPEMLQKLLSANPENHLALEYLKAYYLLTGDRDNYTKLLLHSVKP